MSTETAAALDDASTSVDETLTEEEREERERCEEIAAELTRARVAGMDSRWAERALCASRSYPYDMYPEPTDHRGMAIALGACARCPVRLECLSETLTCEGDTPERTRAGISGGTTPRERWILAGRPKRPGGRSGGGKTPAACATAAAFERHRRNGEECETCTAWRLTEDERENALVQEYREATRDKVPPACGTVEGYAHHRQGRTAVCPRCKLAAKLAGVVWSKRTRKLVPSTSAGPGTEESR